MSKWILGLLALALLGGSLYLRFQNAAETKRQVTAIVAADTAGQDTTQAQNELKTYAATHMGAAANFTLKGSYDRADAAAKQAATAAETANAGLYTQAQKSCGGRRDSVSQAKCVQDYVSARLASGPTPTPAPAPQLAEYRRHFPSPLWTPDLPGALLLGGAAATVFSLFTIKPWRWKRKRHR